MSTDHSSNVHFSSETDNWETPQGLFDRLNSKFNFDLDVCASPDNAKCQKFFTKEQDGLSQVWSGVCWMNPPYGRNIKYWMEKAYLTGTKTAATVVCLVPSRTDTKWWHDYVQPILDGAIIGKVIFIKGRLKFGKATNSAPFPSCLVIYGKDNDVDRNLFSDTL